MREKLKRKPSPPSRLLGLLRRRRKQFFVLGSILLIFLVERLFAESLVYPTYYLLAGIVPCWVTYKLFVRVVKASWIKTRSDIRIFWLNLLSFLILLAGSFLITIPMLWFAFFPETSLQALFDNQLLVGLDIFMVMQGFGLALLGGYIYSKVRKDTKRKPEIIIIRR